MDDWWMRDTALQQRNPKITKMHTGCLLSKSLVSRHPLSLGVPFNGRTSETFHRRLSFTVAPLRIPCSFESSSLKNCGWNEAQSQLKFIQISKRTTSSRLWLLQMNNRRSNPKPANRGWGHFSVLVPFLGEFFGWKNNQFIPDKTAYLSAAHKHHPPKSPIPSQNLTKTTNRQQTKNKLNQRKKQFFPKFTNKQQRKQENKLEKSEDHNNHKREKDKNKEPPKRTINTKTKHHHKTKPKPPKK